MKIKSKIKDYFLEFVDNILNKKRELFSGFKYDRLFYFVDKNVYKLYEQKLKKFIGKDEFVIIPATEHNKSYLKLTDYYKKLIELRFTRKDILVTFGGGILQDLSGFIASTLYRGIKWVLFPTTLLAQADSCIGSKSSINFDDSKNLIGTFYPPDNIFIDVGFCNTLADEYFNSGLGEIIKFHFMSDEEGYALLKRYLNAGNLRNNKYFRKIIFSTLKIKYSYFHGDEFDSGRRNLLNYGHCFGHALEAASNFGVCHGGAVLVGMGFANLLSLKRGLMTKEKYDEFEDIFIKYYPKFNLTKTNVGSLIYYLKRDKKRVTKDLTMILFQDIGKQFKCDDIKEKEIKNVYKEFFSKYSNTLRQL